ncbi:MAG: CopD family protein [Solirubrobacterales bacterium]
MVRGVALAGVLVVAVLAMAAPSASAHAQLEGVTPQRGAVVPTSPATVVFRFDEAIEGNFGAVRVFDSAGTRVDAGDAYHPGGHGEQIAVHLPSSLRPGTYTATYRVVSADGHIVRAAAPSPSVVPARQARRSPTCSPAPTQGRSPPSRWASARASRSPRSRSRSAAWPSCSGAGPRRPPPHRAPPAAAGRGRRTRSTRPPVRRSGALQVLLVASALAGAVGSAVVVVLEGAQAAGISGWSALDPDIVGETLGTKVGAIWGIAVPVWLAVAGLSMVALAVRRRTGSTAVAVALGAALAYLVLVPGLGGHASTQHPVWLMLPANAIHVAAMALWTGGLVTLLVAVPAATRQVAPEGRTRMLAAGLARFSPLALAAVVALTAAGIAQAIVEVRTPAHLLDTAFGRAVLIKALLLVALIAIGAWHRRSSIPRLRAIAVAGGSPAQTGVVVRRALRAEVALLAVVLAVTAALSTYAPSIATTAGPFETTTTIGPAQMQVVVDPAAVGANEIHLYLLNPRDGRQWDRAKEVEISAAQADRGIGPLREQVNRAGPGHYVVTGAPLAVPGDWTLRITVRVSDFDQYERRLEVPIR